MSFTRKSITARQLRHTFRPWMLALEGREVPAIAWSGGATLPAPRAEAAAVLGGSTSYDSVYLFGGQSTTGSTALRLSTGATAWTAMPNLDIVRTSAGAGIGNANGPAGSHVFVFGGGSPTPTDMVINYDPSIGDNQDVSNLNTPRKNFASVGDDVSRLYAIGGVDEDGTVLKSVERYDAALDTWTTVASLPQARQGASAVWDDEGHVLVFGGAGSSGTATSNVYRYSVDSNTWDSLAAMPNTERDGGAVFAPNGNVYVVGGTSGSTTLDVVQVYDPTTNSWTIDNKLPLAVSDAAVLIDGEGRIEVIGGYNSAHQPVASVNRSQRLDIPEVAPVFTSTPVTNASLDKLYGYQAIATGNPDPSFALVTGPAGMTINAQTGYVTWQPIAGQTGTQSVTIRASSWAGQADQSFSIAVVADTMAPTVPTGLLVTGITPNSISLSWNASTDASGIASYKIYESYRGGFHGISTYYRVLASGISTTSFTLTNLASYKRYSLYVAAVDNYGNASARSVGVSATTTSVPVIHLYGSVVTTTDGTRLKAVAQHPISLTVTASSNPAATFSIVSGPAGMSINPTTGVVTWIPTEPTAPIPLGPYEFALDVYDSPTGSVLSGPLTAVFRATNSVGSTYAEIGIDVSADVPVMSHQIVNPLTPNRIVVGQPVTVTIYNTSNTPTTYSLISAPSGTTINSATGTISWTPTYAAAGQQSFIVRGVNTAGQTDLVVAPYVYFTSEPTGVTVDGLNAAVPMLSWTAPTDATNVAGYSIRLTARIRHGRFYTSQVLNFDSPGTDTAIAIDGMVAGRAYTATVTAYDAAHRTSVTSVPLTGIISNPKVPVLVAS